MLTFDALGVSFGENFPPEKGMFKLVDEEHKRRNYTVLNISDMLDEDLDELDEEFGDEFDDLFEEISYLYYDDDSEEFSIEEKRQRILH